MTQEEIYEDIAKRTGGDIYIGIVGPVRTGKSTFIKRFAEQILLPQMKNPAQRSRARDELPQSAAGRTIMTTEPKFIPETAVTVELPQGGSFRARLIDCVGYMVDGALGHEENNHPRMVKSPWFDKAVPFDLAAETGTEKVMREHSTVGLMITTDGSISEIPRSRYLDAERRIVSELESIGRPFLILLNCSRPDSDSARTLAAEMEAEYGRTVLPLNCQEVTATQICQILEKLLYEFSVREIQVDMPRWITVLEPEHPLQSALYQALLGYAEQVSRMKDAATAATTTDCEAVRTLAVSGMDLAQGIVHLQLTLQPDIFYKILGEASGLEIYDEASLMPCIIRLAHIQKEYAKVKSALEQVEATGYGIVMPSIDELRLEPPEIVKQGGQYGVRLSASAPSIHLLRANIQTEIHPTVGSEKQSEELVQNLLAGFSADPLQIWDSNIFGKSLHELVNEGLQNKLLHMPAEARTRLQETLERIINEGCSGLICIIL